MKLCVDSSTYPASTFWSALFTPPLHSGLLYMLEERRRETEGDLYIIVETNCESLMLKSKMSVFALKKSLRTHVILLRKIYLTKVFNFW